MRKMTVCATELNFCAWWFLLCFVVLLLKTSQIARNIYSFSFCVKLLDTADFKIAECSDVLHYFVL
jgi:hypothetical protein